MLIVFSFPSLVCKVNETGPFCAECTLICVFVNGCLRITYNESRIGVVSCECFLFSVKENYEEEVFGFVISFVLVAPRAREKGV